jgi:hypothetical protein
MEPGTVVGVHSGRGIDVGPNWRIWAGAADDLADVDRRADELNRRAAKLLAEHTAVDFDYPEMG